MNVTINSESTPIPVVTNAGTVAAVLVAKQGPRGLAGDSTLIKVAGEPLGGHRVVRLNSANQAMYCDGSDVTHAGKVVGITTGAASVGTQAIIRNSGELSEGSWSWTPGAALFVGANGQLSETPGVAFTQQVALAITSTSIIINIHSSII